VNVIIFDAHKSLSVHTVFHGACPFYQICMEFSMYSKLVMDHHHFVDLGTDVYMFFSCWRSAFYFWCRDIVITSCTTAVINRQTDRQTLITCSTVSHRRLNLRLVNSE